MTSHAEQQMRACAFRIPTNLSWEEVVRRCEIVVSGFKALTRQMKITGQQPIPEIGGGGIIFSITNLWLFEQALILLTYGNDGQQPYLQLEAHEYMVTQQRLLYFIPVGRKQAPAANDFRILSARLRRAFEAPVYPPSGSAQHFAPVSSESTVSKSSQLPHTQAPYSREAYLAAGYSEEQYSQYVNEYQSYLQQLAQYEQAMSDYQRQLAEYNAYTEQHNPYNGSTTTYTMQ